MSGEQEQPWQAEGRWPTAEEWRAYFLAMPPDRQLEAARQVLVAAQVQSECWSLDHVGELERSRRVHVLALEARDRYRLAWLSAARRART